MRQRVAYTMLTIVVMGLFGLMIWSVEHEEAHSVIYKIMCANATTKTGFLYTELTSPGNCDPNMQLAHAINETGYQTGPLLALIVAVLSGLLAYAMLGDKQ